MIRFAHIFLALCLFCMPSQGLARQDMSREARAVFHYLNQIRTQAGMIPFKWNPILERAASAHAIYLAHNRIVSHVELPGKPYYTGASPGDRAIVQGYDVRNVTENHSSGGSDPLDSVDGLMGAIYHRFGFLDFTKDEIGIALTTAEQGLNIVYKMGNEGLNRYCKVAINTGEGPWYENFCKRVNLVPVKRVVNLEREAREKNPPIVVWPPRGGVDLSPVFYDEIPDPLPNISVSGYPVSIQFNPVFYANVQLLSFELFELGQGEPAKVGPVHLLQRRNDPHRKFSKNEFALFPLNRLEWGTDYQARVKYEHDGLEMEHRWTFKTRQLPHPMFVIAASGDSLVVNPDKTYSIYVPPGDRFPYIEQLSVEAPYTVRVVVNWEDRNTILLTLSGELCQPVRFQLDGMRFFSVRLAQNDNLNSEQHYPETAAVTCE